MNGILGSLFGDLLGLGGYSSMPGYQHQQYQPSNDYYQYMANSIRNTSPDPVKDENVIDVEFEVVEPKQLENK